MTVDLDDRVRTRAFLTVLIAFVLDVMDSTIVTVAIPDIQSDMHLTHSAMQWSVAGYFLSFAVLLVTGGRLGDIHGHRRMFLIGVAGFTLSSMFCGLAANADQLVAARVAQGATAALMAPQVMAIVQILYSPTERIGRLAFFGILGGFAAIAGPIVGGLLIEADLFGLGWRAVFLINLPLGLIGLLCGWRYLPHRRAGGKAGLDLLGIAMLAVTLCLLLVPIIDGGSKGWPLWSTICLAFVLPMAAAFMMQQSARQKCKADALIAPVLFRDRGYTLGLLAVLFFAIGTGGLFMPLMLTLQNGLGFSAFEAGLLHIPFAGGVMAGIAGLGRKFLPRFGRIVVVAGAAVMGLSLTLLSAVLIQGVGGIPAILISLFVAGTGMGMVSGPLAPLALARVDTAYAGMASGAFKSTQQIGGAIGAASLGALFFLKSDAHKSAVVAMGWTTIGIVSSLFVVLILALAMPHDPFRLDGQKNPIK